MRRTTTTTLNTTQKVCLWVGMESRFLTGCISSMAWAKSSSVRSAAGLVTGVAAPLKSISKNGAMHME